MLSIVILSYRSPALIRLALRSLARALDGTALPYEVIVVDSQTSPETANVVLHDFAGVFPALRLIPFKENTGYTAGVNAGLRAARGEILLALNYDIVPEAGTIEAMVRYLRDHPEVGLIGPRLLNFDQSQQDSCFRFYTPGIILARRLRFPFTSGALRRFALRDRSITRPTAVDWVSGSALMTTRAALEQVGLLDESLFHYFSDVDWAWRYWENGLGVVFYPLAAMTHALGRTSKGRFGILDPLFNRATRWHIADAVRYFRKHGISGRRPHDHGPLQPRLLTAQI
jgi:GT2 family glycosyltransferase